VLFLLFSSRSGGGGGGGGVDPATRKGVTHWFEPPFAPAFYLALPDPRSDHNTRVILTNHYEDPLGDAFRVVLEGRCLPGTVVVDIGANLGVFSAASAAFGCSVLAVEAQTRLIPYVRDTVVLNHWHDRIAVRNVAVFDKPGELRIAYYDPLTSKTSGWLSMAMDEKAIEECPNKLGCTVEVVQVVETHTLVTGDTELVKIDVDGPEAVILKALLPALSKYTVGSILVEVCPPGWKSHISKEDGMAVLRRVMEEFRYDLVVLDQIEFTAYKPGFLERCTLIENVFRPKAYAVPLSMLDELFDDATAAVNCKNVVFTHLDELLASYKEHAGNRQRIRGG
jgi:FkbM family methyltransferase